MKKSKNAVLTYLLIIEATEDPDFFGFFAPDLDDFTGIGTSIADCVHKARQGIKEHTALLRTYGFPVPRPSRKPVITFLR
ncbi:MAG: type II toxin-antitoxin system HicB family antitoxin [Chloroflexi bacterium]|nr:type II toxin-antitoxin system HicB family antitoxin [Chloroflexota bacterium]